MAGDGIGVASTSGLRDMPDIDYEPTGTGSIMTLRPTWDEFKDFSAFVAKAEEAGAHIKSGIVKVIPPPEFNPRPSKKDVKDIERYVLNGADREMIVAVVPGVYDKRFPRVMQSVKVTEYKKMAFGKKYSCPLPENARWPEIEEYYWSNITEGEAIYGADNEGGFYDHDVNTWNISRLGTILDESKVEQGAMPGVHTAYMYFGMWKTTFAWHAEDMDLYSINYLHFGAPKFWYSISPESTERFERLMQAHFPADFERCPTFARHKSIIISPELLRLHNIKYGTMIQRANEFILTFPQGYHMGFNSGYNCAESTNFASPRWIDFGMNSTVCECDAHPVTIDMRNYALRYRPELYPKWEEYWYTVDSTLKAQESQATQVRRRFAGMWATCVANLELEQRWNTKRAREGSHCAVCQYFCPDEAVVKRKEAVPHRSRRYTTFLCFSKNPVISPTAPDLQEDELLTCERCLVTVHRRCYPEVPQQGATWRCQRCQQPSSLLVSWTSCRLCKVRGGAFVRCQSGSDEGWAHVICAILSRSVCFADPNKRDLAIHKLPPRYGRKDTNIPLPDAYQNQLSTQGLVFICALCKRRDDAVLRCAKCATTSTKAFYAHATCARAAKLRFEIREYPDVAVFICDGAHNVPKGPPEKKKPGQPIHPTQAAIDLLAVDDDDSDLSEEERERLELYVGERVAIVAPKGRETGIVVEKMCVGERCIIEFRDSDSVTYDTECQFIKSCNCKRCDNVHHTPGARVKVLWKDQELYEGRFRKTHLVYKYKVVKQANQAVRNYYRAQLRRAAALRKRKTPNPSVSPSPVNHADRPSTSSHDSETTCSSRLGSE
ncbi:unnamed protein product, partial [Mesorhabditis spiculigera]